MWNDICCDNRSETSNIMNVKRHTHILGTRVNVKLNSISLRRLQFSYDILTFNWIPSRRKGGHWKCIEHLFVQNFVFILVQLICDSPLDVYVSMWECVQQFKFILTVDWLAADEVRRQIGINYRSELIRCEWNRCEIELENGCKSRSDTFIVRIMCIEYYILQIHTIIRGCCVLADTESIEWNVRAWCVERIELF